MKRFLRILLAITVAGTIAILLYIIQEKISVKQQAVETLQTLPPLSLYNTDSIRVDLSSLGRQPTVIVYYNSECDYCKNEVASFEENIAQLECTNIIFVSMEEIKAIGEFKNEFNFTRYPNVHFLKIDPDDVYKNFGTISVPHLYIYSKSGKLLKEFNGETKIDAIIKYLKD